MILTVDLGSTATKAVVWGDAGPLAVGRCSLVTGHPEPGRVEQDPEQWWVSVVEACARARAVAPRSWEGIDAVVFAAARATFVAVDGSGQPLAPAILWSDQRGPTTAARAQWMIEHRPHVMGRARWLLAPRDLVAWRMTGVVRTDRTLASRTGWYTPDGDVLPTSPGDLLPPVGAPTDVVGGLLPGAAAELLLRPGAAVVCGAGDRPCEVLGTAAAPDVPMISWGTTANVSVPATSADGPAVAAVSPGALGGYLLECGLSAAGSALDWWSRLTGRPLVELLADAGTSPPGARGVVALAWLNGARAPWWEPLARGALLGLTPAHSAGDVARAWCEAVALDAARSLAALGVVPSLIAGAGGGAAGELWPAILAGVTGVPIQRRRPELAASAGARIIAGAAVGESVDADGCNPVTDVVEPDPAWVEAYGTLRARADRVAGTIVGLT